jgi:hypothetical protein
VLAETTADLAFALLLATARRVVEADRFVRSGGWPPERRWEPDMLLGRDVHGSVLGILGLGQIGRAMARRAAGFGMRVLGWSRSERPVPGVEQVPLEELLAEADAVTVHLALTPETRGLLDARALARMKPGAILVNSAPCRRGHRRLRDGAPLPAKSPARARERGPDPTHWQCKCRHAGPNGGSRSRKRAGGARCATASALREPRGLRGVAGPHARCLERAARQELARRHHAGTVVAGAIRELPIGGDDGDPGRVIRRLDAPHEPLVRRGREDETARSGSRREASKTTQSSASARSKRSTRSMTRACIGAVHQSARSRPRSTPACSTL